jgi:hypothetical protein
MLSTKFNSKTIGRLLLDVENFLSIKDLQDQPIQGTFVGIVFRSESKSSLINLSSVDLKATDCEIKSKIYEDINLTIDEMLKELESYLSTSTVTEMKLYDESGSNEVTFTTLNDILAIYMSTYDDLEILESLDSENLDKIVMRSLHIGETCNFSGDETIIENYPNETYLICMLYNLVKLRLICDEEDHDLTYGVTYILPKKGCKALINEETNPIKLNFCKEYEYGNARLADAPQNEPKDGSSEFQATDSSVKSTGLYIQIFSGSC